MIWLAIGLVTFFILLFILLFGPPQSIEEKNDIHD